MSEAEQIKEQIFQQTALRLFSLQQSFLRNRQNKTRLAYQSGALEALELLIKEINIWDEYEEWRKHGNQNNLFNSARRGRSA